jgi:hypothetical protein
MVKPRIYADFQTADSFGRLRLNCVGTVEDLSQHQIELREGLALTLYSDDLDNTGQLDELLIDSVVTFSEEEHCWVAVIDWAAIRNASAGQGLQPNGSPTPTSDRVSPDQSGFL